MGGEDTYGTGFGQTETVDADLLKPIKDVNEKWKLLPAFLQVRRFARYTTSADEVVTYGVLVLAGPRFGSATH